MTKVCVTICTRERPKMLASCLESILPQIAASAVSSRVIVVENDGESKCQNIVDIISERFNGIDVQYVLENEMGIPFARNKAVEESLHWGADWIVFIDDDEVADKGWFDNLTAAIKDLPADVLHGPVRLIYPDNYPAWQRMKSFDGGAHGNLLNTAATNNTAARAWLFSGDRAGLRFDPAFRFSGGEDVDLFERARGIGARIVWTADAQVAEHVPNGRLSETWHLQRARQLAANATIALRRRGGNVRAAAFVATMVLRLVAETCVCALLAVVHLPIQEKRMLHAFRVRIKLMKTMGYVRGLFGYAEQIYKNVEGY